jgi:hypothetical protein
MVVCVAVSPVLASERASEAAEVQVVEAIKCFDNFARLAAVATTSTDVERSLLASCVCSRRTRQAIRSVRPPARL